MLSRLLFLAVLMLHCVFSFHLLYSPLDVDPYRPLSSKGCISKILIIMYDINACLLSWFWYDVIF